MNTSVDDPEAQEERLLRRLASQPRDADALLQLGWLRLQRGEFLAARDSLLSAHVLQPRSPIIRIYAARALVECGDYRAQQLIRDWRDWLPLPEQQQYDLADAMQHTDWTAESIDVLEDLLQRSPQFRPARLLLAALYERVNRLEDASALVDRMLAEDLGDEPQVYNELAHQKAHLLARSGEPQAAQRLLEEVGPKSDRDADHFFLLGAIADRVDDADAAMRHLGTAHALQIGLLERAAPQRLQPGEALLPAAAESLDADDLARWPNLVAPDTTNSPILVVGFPRSGTTLLEQMLDAHPALQAMDERPHFYVLASQLEDYGIRVPGDLYKLTQSDCDELRKGYLMMACDKVRRRWGARLVDKNPLNMLWLPLIHRIFPAAQFILALRHPCDVLLSNYLQNYRAPVLMAASRDLEHLARAYVEAFSHWFHHVAILKPAVLTVRYENLVGDQVRTAASIGSFLGLENTDAMLQADRHARGKGFIGTPSYTQVIEPVHRRAIGRWQRYRPWFTEALPILAPVLERLGYSTETDG
ncbi:MAG TPA: sulfotransferase [Rhodanobacteraceae bacterium]|nr:sulfotransferase [Rhodanobacteraceae bacterium]